MKNLRDIMKKLPADGNVRRALRQFNLSPNVQAKAKSVKDLAESLGFSVSKVALPKGVAGCLVQDPFSENGYEIRVNSYQSVESNRWAVLHEMGHYFLHENRDDPLADPMYLDRSGLHHFYVDTQQEKEANEFAAALLFGDGALSAARSLYGDDLHKLRIHFGVSETTIKIAMKQF